MGRKRGLPARAREKAAAEEVMQAIEEDQRESLLRSKPDDALFVVDAQGSKRKRMKIEKEARSEKYLSKHEKKIIDERYLGKQTHRKKNKAGAKNKTRVSDIWDDDAALAPKAGDGGAVVAISSAGGGGGGAGTTTGPGAATAGDEDFVEPPRQPGKPKTAPKPSARDLAKLGVCHPGQSYNPSEEDHDDVLASAVAVELRREEALADENTPVGSGMSKETLDILIDDKDFGASDDEAGGRDDGELPLSIGKKTPATGKLTRTERNRQLRRKLSAKELGEKKRKKDLLKSIDSLDDMQMELARDEAARKEKRTLKRLFKARKAKEEAAGAVAGGLFGPGSGIIGMGDKGHASNRDIIAGRSLAVNLKEELHGSMRKLKSQGSLLMDKVELLKASKAHPDARRAKQRAKKVPKGFRKKFKYADRYKDG